ncbi:GntR family transcriptional regulator [Nocardiopsis trehalosi]|uniref:GntR family transcriptional regulator n=1 Tax=Nocardiopsis trehalosi TaxID=109329 RepID=UPI000AC10C0A|nr:GntR family transcriptional regulator [Nocardiopsis trehalosi]
MTTPPLPPLAVDRTSPVPLYFQVAQELERHISDGALPAGTRLENEVLLADRLGLSRPTVRRAIAYLVDRGLLVRRRGVGTQVVTPRVRRPVELSSLYDDLEHTGRRPRTEVLGFRVEPASDTVAADLEIAPGDEVYLLERLRYAGDEPLALMRNTLPRSLVDLSAAALTEHGLYRLLRASGVVLKVASQSIGARAATAAESRALGDPRGAPLLTMDRTVYDDTGRVVESATHVYRASHYTFELTLTT